MQGVLKKQGRRKYNQIQENDLQNSLAFLQMQVQGKSEPTWVPGHQMGGPEVKSMIEPIQHKYCLTLVPELDQFQMLEMESQDCMEKPGIASFETGVWDTVNHF